MMGMSIPYLETGRTKQKSRTRQALIDAARSLIADGVTPTVEQAAEAAGISRTTAYRYFPNQRDLLIAAHPQIDDRSLLGSDPPADVRDRVERVIDAVIETTTENEAALRTMLRLALDPSTDRDALLLRQGRAIGWLTEAIEPLRGRMPKRDRERLVLAIRSAVGIEAMVWLCDVAGLDRDEAGDVMRWSGRALLDAALARTS
jgi:AcrR family transcriptional regulator